MAVSLFPASLRLTRPAVEEKSILGYKTSAAFLSSLGSNLRLEFATPRPSPVSTPVLTSRDDVAELAPLPQIDSSGKSVSLVVSKAAPQTPALSPRARPSMSSLSQSPWYRRQHRKSSPIAQSTRQGTFEAVTIKDPETQSLALRMIALSVRSQWLLAVWSMCTHPLNAFGFLLLLCSVPWYGLVTDSQGSTDPGFPALIRSYTWLWTILLWLIVTGLTVGSLMFFLRSLYSPVAARINSMWLDGDEILVIVRSIGRLQYDGMTVEPVIEGLDQIAGALVLSWQVREAQVSKCRRRKFSKGFIRAWAVQDPMQNRGVGTALLREAARIVAARGGQGLWFAKDHAHSVSVLPSIYNSPFNRRDRFADRLLTEVLEEEMISFRKY